jgi:hypothetical protein
MRQLQYKSQRKDETTLHFLGELTGFGLSLHCSAGMDSVLHIVSEQSILSIPSLLMVSSISVTSLCPAQYSRVISV